MKLVLESALLDDVLETYRAAMGRDFRGYRGHVYRTFNFALALSGASQDSKELALAAAFHDIGIWTDGTFDYLEPSARRASQYVAARRLDVDVTELEHAVLHHHGLRSRRGVSAFVEAFRRADWADVSWGLLSWGVPKELVRDAHAAFPNAGFHGCLLREGVRWAMRHPWRALPMLRW